MLAHNANSHWPVMTTSAPRFFGAFGLNCFPLCFGVMRSPLCFFLRMQHLLHLLMQHTSAQLSTKKAAEPMPKGSVSFELNKPASSSSGRAVATASAVVVLLRN